MNEFTKEDLEIILDGILWRDAHILPCDRPEKLKSKIQSMIDGYCEHENIVSYNEANCVYFCMDCSVVTGAI